VSECLLLVMTLMIHARDIAVAVQVLIGMGEFICAASNLVRRISTLTYLYNLAIGAKTIVEIVQA
jgi:hypothetical protein